MYEVEKSSLLKASSFSKCHVWVASVRLTLMFMCLVLNAMTAEDYRTVYWPKLERAIEHLLTQSPMDHISISYEQIYRLVLLELKERNSSGHRINMLLVFVFLVHTSNMSFLFSPLPVTCISACANNTQSSSTMT